MKSHKLRKTVLFPKSKNIPCSSGWMRDLAQQLEARPLPLHTWEDIGPPGPQILPRNEGLTSCQCSSGPVGRV